MSEIVGARVEIPKHVKLYIDEELSSYPIYHENLVEAMMQLTDERESLARMIGESPGSGGGTTSDPVNTKILQISILENNIKHWEWRTRKTDRGLCYFANRPDYLKLIQAVWFDQFSCDMTEEEIREQLGYASNKTKYYRMKNKVYWFFSKIYGVMP